ncbi:hypothetical protein L9F63_024540, partial [Diploptera punctata]
MSSGSQNYMDGMTGFENYEQEQNVCRKEVEEKPWHGYSKHQLYLELQCIQNQLQDAEMKIQELKTELDKQELKMSDLELENNSLNCELTSNNSIIKQFMESAAVLVEDLHTLQKALKESDTDVHLNLNRIQ